MRKKNARNTAVPFLKRIFTAEAFAAAAALLVVICVLFVKPFAGVADNGDFERVTAPSGLVPMNGERFAYFGDKYGIKTVKEQEYTGIVSLMNAVLQSAGRDKSAEGLGYFSTQIVPIKLAMMLNVVVQGITTGNMGILDIRFLAFIYAAVYIAAIYLIVKLNKTCSKARNAVLAVLVVFMFCDAAYLAYFNSFFGEAAAMVFFLMTLGSAFYVTRQAKPSVFSVVCFYVAAMLFTGSKEANAPLGVLLAMLGAGFLFIRRDLLMRCSVIVLSAALLFFSLFLYKTIPEEIRMINQYQTVFFGILKDSPTPEKDLEELGLNPGFIVLKDTTFFTEDLPIDPHSSILKKEFYPKAGYGSILKFYFKHPERFVQKLEIAARNGMMIRPPYLGTYRAEDGYERGRMTSAFTIWSSFKKIYLPSSLVSVFVFFVLYLAGLVYEFIKVIKSGKGSKGLPGLLVFALVPAAAVIQFVIPVLGDGEGDLAKHMFLFTMCYDLMLLSAAIWTMEVIGGAMPGIIGFCRRRKVHVLLAAGAAGLAAVYVFSHLPQQGKSLPSGSDMSASASGDYVSFGSYLGTPIVWRVADKETDKGVLLIADRILCLKPFDAAEKAGEADGERRKYGSSLWETSNLRSWLNSADKQVVYRNQPPDREHVWNGLNAYDGEQGFLSGFTPQERAVIKPVLHAATLSEADMSFREGGSRLLYWSSPVMLACQNWESAFRMNTRDYVFIPDVKELKEYVYSKGLNARKTLAEAPAKDMHVEAGYWEYWLRTPYSGNSSYVRYVGKDGFVYNKDAFYGLMGVVPSLYIDAAAEISGGMGTADAPYMLKASESTAAVNAKKP